MTNQPTPGSARKAIEAVHTLALALWLGATGMSAAVAAIVFPLMRSLNPRVGGVYAAYEGDHANLLAGMVAAKVFSVADMITLGSASVALLAVILLIGFLSLPVRRWSTALRLITLCGALALVSYKLMALDPPMAEHLNAYWSAAASNDVESATASREAFGTYHPIASRVLGSMVVLLVAALISSVWSAQGGGYAGRDELKGGRL